MRGGDTRGGGGGEESVGAEGAAFCGAGEAGDFPVRILEINP